MLQFAFGVLLTMIVWAISVNMSNRTIIRMSKTHGTMVVDSTYLRVIPESDYLLMKEKANMWNERKDELR